MKDTFCMAVGALGAAIASLYGGWDAALQTLILGDEALQYCRELVVADSPVLSRIEIGSGCFMKGNALSLGSGIVFIV